MVITIPKNLVKGKEDLVVISRKEYEKLLYRAPKVVQEVPMTTSEKKAFVRAEKNLKAGKTLTLDELAKRLGIPRR